MWSNVVCGVVCARCLWGMQLDARSAGPGRSRACSMFVQPYTLESSLVSCVWVADRTIIIDRINLIFVRNFAWTK